MMTDNQILYRQYIYDLRSNLTESASRLYDILKQQLGNVCQCSQENILDMKRRVLYCGFDVTDMRRFLNSPVFKPFLDLVDHSLEKALELLNVCDPKVCDSDCRRSCEMIRRSTHLYLHFRSKFPGMLLYLLEVLKDDPHWVVCRCSSHLNALELYGYLLIARLVIHKIISPTSGICGAPSEHAGDCLVEKSPIHCAAILKNIPETVRLLQTGADVNSLDQCCHTPLHIATILKDCDYAKMLLDFGADPLAKDEHNNTPLLLATIIQDTEMVKLLCSKASSIFASNKDGFSPILMALSSRNKELLEIMTSTEEVSGMNRFHGSGVYKGFKQHKNTEEGSGTSRESVGTAKGTDVCEKEDKAFERLEMEGEKGKGKKEKKGKKTEK